MNGRGVNGIAAGRPVWPMTVAVDEIACMLNLELADDPTYDGVELQWFDDDRHGSGMLAFLSRRDGRQIDYYVEPGLQLDRAAYQIGGGTGSWNEIIFDEARLVVTVDGVDAAARFTDVDGNTVEVRVDDRDGRARRPAALLAPVGAAVEAPVSLMLVWMPRFDLVRDAGTDPLIRIAGRHATIGRLPGERLHRRHLIKYAAPVVVALVNAAEDGRPSTPGECQRFEHDHTGALTTVWCAHAGHEAKLVLDPGLPDPGELADGSVSIGHWHVEVDGARLTGGAWHASRRGGTVECSMEADERWQPGRLPWLMRVVTTVVPVFRRWPTTYRWQAEIPLAPDVPVTSRWERTTTEMATSYRRTTRT